jgi:uncharacterized protein (UPF0261 family)
VVSLGAAEIGTFGPPETVPEQYRDRLLYRHNESITLMRIDAAEAGRLGRLLAGKLNAATGPVTLCIPTGGLSALSLPGAVFHDPEADAALFEALEAELEPRVEVVRLEADINDPTVAVAMAERLDRSISGRLDKASLS